MNRKPPFITRLSALMVLCLAALSAQAQDFSAGELVVRGPWARPLPPVAANGAVYLGVINRAPHAERLISASTPIAERVEVHTSVHSGSMMMMKRLDALEIGAQDTVTLAPGGTHLMLVGVNQPLTAGQSFPLNLIFDKAGALTVTVLVGARENSVPLPPSSHPMPAKKHAEHGKSAQ